MFMKSFEPVYKELEYLLIQKLPDYIEKINKEHNDGIILKPFKDRIIENTVYTICLEIKLSSNTEDEQIIFWRYAEAVIEMIYSEDTEYFFDVSKMKGNLLYLRVSNEY